MKVPVFSFVDLRGCEFRSSCSYDLSTQFIWRMHDRILPASIRIKSL